MPRPPPPAEALMMTGKPTLRAPFHCLAFATEHAFRPRENRHAGLFHCGASFFLFAHQAGDFRRRADELDVAGLADFGKVSILGQQAVAGMDRVHVGDFGGADDSRNIQIALRQRRRADADSFIGKTHVQRVAVGFAIDRDRPDSQLLAGANHPQSNFAAVRNEDLLKHRLQSSALSRQGTQNWPPIFMDLTAWEDALKIMGSDQPCFYPCRSA